MTATIEHYINDQRVSREGVIVIKAQASRSLEQNKLEAVARLQALVADRRGEQRLREQGGDAGARAVPAPPVIATSAPSALAAPPSSDPQLP